MSDSVEPYYEGTTHIREMLARAIDACEEADDIWAEAKTLSERGQPMYLGDDGLAEMKRLIKAAGVDAIHAYGELATERMFVSYGREAFVPRR
jgi:hypothetical protein